jgi:hypothetical protein
MSLTRGRFGVLWLVVLGTNYCFERVTVLRAGTVRFDGAACNAWASALSSLIASLGKSEDMQSSIMRYLPHKEKSKSGERISWRLTSVMALAT